jgi:hypothetical protein
LQAVDNGLPQSLRIGHDAAMRPRLHPSLTRIWRDSGTFQLGITPGHAVILGGLRAADAAILRAIDGGHTVEQLHEVARIEGAAPAAADHLVQTLIASDAVVDGDLCAASLAGLDPDAASAGLLSEALDAGAAAMARREQSHVRIKGAGRIGATVARLLDAAGVGTISVDDSDITSTADLSPGGLADTDTGLPRDRAVRTHLPTPPQAANTDPDLVVIAPAFGPASENGASLLRAGIAHLVVQVVETTGFVGPLVVPGHSACLRCIELHRTDHDPLWPLVIDQSVHRPPPVPACDVALATTVAALAASHVISHLDGFQVSSIGGSIEISLPAAHPRRRTWPVHPECGCSWEDEP